MSKALYEPSTMRQLAQMKYDTRQLQRRPASGASSGVFEPMYPTFYNVELFNDFPYYENSSIDSSLQRIASVKIDATVPHGAIRNNYDNTAFVGGTTRTATDGDAMVIPLRTGPRGTWWGLNVGYKKGPDFGIMKFSWIGPSLEADGPNWVNPMADCGGDAIESLYQLYDDVDVAPTAAFVDYFETIDCYYGGGGQQVELAGVLSDFRITGDVGTYLTAFTTPSGSDECYTRRWGDGGPGIYWLKISVSGKNASSSGYKMALWAVTWSVFDDSVPPHA